MLPARRWKRSLQLGICRGMRWKHFTDGKQNTCLPIFDCLQTEKATRQRRPLLQLKTRGLMLPERPWKRSLQLGICRGDANGNILPTANKIPVCRSLIVYKQRGRRGNVALFYSRKRSGWCFRLVAGSAYCNSVYARWDAMETLYPRQTKYLFADLSVFTSGEDDDVTSSSCAVGHEAIDATSSSLEALGAT